MLNGDSCRRLRFCEYLTLALGPLEVGVFRTWKPPRATVGARPRDRAEALCSAYTRLGRLRELALCLAVPYELEAFISPAAWRVAEQPWVCALLTAPRQLQLLLLEIDYACFLPPLTNLRHLLLFVRRALAHQVKGQSCMLMPQ